MFGVCVGVVMVFVGVLIVFVGVVVVCLCVCRVLFGVLGVFVLVMWVVMVSNGVLLDRLIGNADTILGPLILGVVICRVCDIEFVKARPKIK